MNKLLILNIDQFPEDDILGRYRQFFSDYKKPLLDTLPNPSSSLRLIADLFLRYELYIEWELDPARSEIQTDVLGKPFVPGLEQHSFNLSHTTDKIALLLSDKPCGVDIESSERVLAEEKLVRRYFHEQEAGTYFNLPPERRRSYFFRIWTLKEAYLKAEGSGIRRQLKSIGFRLSSTDNSVILDTDSQSPWIFRIYDDLRYSLICSTAVQTEFIPEKSCIHYSDIERDLLACFK